MISRRAFISATAALAATPLVAKAQSYPTVLDYSSGVPSGSAVKAAGHIGAIRYVSAKREAWMGGKPVSRKETEDFAAHGLYTASIYQYGRADTADWKQGAAGALIHAPQAIYFHQQAGGPHNVPIYVAIDDNPTAAQYNEFIAPYLQSFKKLLELSGYSLGVYGNYSTIDWCIRDGLGTHFWEHNWGSQGKVHPRANLHQVKNTAGSIEGVPYDLNYVYSTDWGQWQPSGN